MGIDKLSFCCIISQEIYFKGGSMKKFLVFLVSIVVVVSFGLVTYYFLRNDEVINFKENEIYCNVGDIVTINDLGKSVTKASNKTKYNYNGADETVTNAVSFDDNKGYYLAKQGGDFEVIIKTSNKKFPEFKFTFHIGDGSDANPYFVKDEQTLSKIGNIYSLSSSYVLKSDILLSNSFSPIGYDGMTSSWAGFTGVFDGENHTITGTNYNLDVENIGFFYSLNGATVKNLNLNKFKFEGSYSNAGILAGKATNAVVTNVKVSESAITNIQTGANTAGLIGKADGNLTNITKSAVNDIVLSTGNATDINANVAGFVGSLSNGTIRACYATGEIATATDASSNSKIAGFVANFEIDGTNGSIQQSYSAVTTDYSDFAGFIHSFNGNIGSAKYLRYLIGNYAVTQSKVAVKTVPDSYTTYFDEAKGIYGVKSYNTISDLEAETNYVYYALNGNKVSWDNFIWKFIPGSLPTLLQTNLTPSTVSSEYFISDGTKEYVDDVTSFMSFINDCRTTDGKIKDKNYELQADIDMSGIEWSAIDVENSIINGNGHKIKNLVLKNTTNNNLSFFGTVKSSAIKNIVFENVKIESNANSAAVFANTITTAENADGASSIEKIEISFADAITNNFDQFAGFANTIENSKVTELKVTNLTIADDASIVKVASVANTIGSDSRLENTTITATLKASENIAGVANTNNGSILNTVSTLVLAHKASSRVDVAGIAVQNVGQIEGADLNLTITAAKSLDNSNFAGLVVENNGSIQNAKLAGEGISIEHEVADFAYIAGMVVTNNGRLISSKCLMAQLGSFNAGKRQYVAGIAINNSNEKSVISQCQISSKLEGNTVAGAIIKMDNASASADQIVIGVYDAENKTLTQNFMKADRFVAGVAIDLRKGNISNVQTSSEIYGAANSTVSSLIVLIFPNGASFKNAKIDSTFSGYSQNRYSECWQDFRNASKTVKDELGYNTTGNSDRSFDILDYDASAGSLQSVIINKSAAERNGATFQTASFISEGIFFGLFQWPSYENTENSSFFRLVSDSDFNKSSTYKTITMSSKTGFFNLGSIEYVKVCAFDTNATWTETSNSGLYLTFLVNA